MEDITASDANRALEILAETSVARQNKLENLGEDPPVESDQERNESE